MNQEITDGPSLESILSRLNEKKRQACQLHPRAMVVSIEEAEKALRHLAKSMNSLNEKEK